MKAIGLFVGAFLVTVGLLLQNPVSEALQARIRYETFLKRIELVEIRMSVLGKIAGSEYLPRTSCTRISPSLIMSAIEAHRAVTEVMTFSREALREELLIDRWEAHRVNHYMVIGEFFRYYQRYLQETLKDLLSASESGASCTKLAGLATIFGEELRLPSVAEKK